MQIELYFMGTDEQAKNLCGNVDHQTKKDYTDEAFYKQKESSNAQGLVTAFGVFGGFLFPVTTETDFCQEKK